MNLEEGKMKFIHSWGKLGTHWGISRTMAQVHALLLISKEPLTTEEVMEDLKISRGNANMNLRALMDWNLVHKQLIPGERKEFFIAEKDMWEVARNVIIQRKKKELEPMLKVLDEISEVEGLCCESEEFCKIIKDVKLFSTKADSTLSKLSRADAQWFVGTFMKII